MLTKIIASIIIVKIRKYFMMIINIISKINIYLYLHLKSRTFIISCGIFAKLLKAIFTKYLPKKIMISFSMKFILFKKKANDYVMYSVTLTIIFAK